MEASVMSSEGLRCGVCTLVRSVRNPVKLARAVMERTPHILLSGGCGMCWGTGVESVCGGGDCTPVSSACYLVKGPWRHFAAWCRAGCVMCDRSATSSHTCLHAHSTARGQGRTPSAWPRVGGSRLSRNGILRQRRERSSGLRHAAGCCPSRLSLGTAAGR